MAHKVGQGSASNTGDSLPKYRGIKRNHGEAVISGNIIVRQVGTKFKPGRGVGLGKDFTIFATSDGRVQFKNGTISVIA
jgi:large subunit ribosomal protein L27